MKRITILSQVYPPDEAAVGQLLEDVARDLADAGNAVHVVTSSRGFDDPRREYPATEIRGGVHIKRIRALAAAKTKIPRRFVVGLWHAVSAASRLLGGERSDVIVVTESPPMGALFGLLVARLRRAKTVYWLTDINPDQAIAAGVLSPSSFRARLFRWWAGMALKLSDVVITLDDEMRRRVLAYRVPLHKLVVIPPWSSITGPPAAQRVLESRSKAGWQGKTVVMYAGNHSPVHPLSTLLDAARERPTADPLIFVFAGGGSMKPSIDAIVTDNIRTLPYSPREQVSLLLTSADVHVVVMGEAMRGIVHPSKLYGALAAGRPILLVGNGESSVGRVVRSGQLGWTVAHGDRAGMGQALDEIAALSAADLHAMSIRVRAVFERDHDPRVSRRAFVAEVLRLANTP